MVSDGFLVCCELVFSVTGEVFCETGSPEDVVGFWLSGGSEDLRCVGGEEVIQCSGWSSCEGVKTVSMAPPGKMLMGQLPTLRVTTTSTNKHGFQMIYGTYHF